MRPYRALRRLKARWRLHRMEWDAMHRPLQPPKGYEHMYEPKAVFPGLDHKWNKYDSFSDLLDDLKLAWRFYKHKYVHDPEIAKLEKQILEGSTDSQQDFQKTAEDLIQRGVELKEEGKKVAEDFAQEMKKQRPVIENIATDRVEVVRDSISQFAEGYREGSQADLSFVGDILNSPFSNNEDEQKHNKQQNSTNNKDKVNTKSNDHNK